MILNLNGAMPLFHSLLTTAILFASQALGDAGCPAPLHREVAAMGTTLRAAVCAQSFEHGLALSEAGFAEVRRLEDVLSSWTLTSEVGRINGGPGHGRLGLSAELYGLLAEVGDWVRETNGAFDPAVGALVDAWQLRSGGRVPTAPELEKALRLTGWRHLQLCDSQTIVRGPQGWWLDTGGFGKGAALRSLAAMLRRSGVRNAEFDFGGQLLILGAPRQIMVADPRDRERAAMRLRVQDVSVSTSSQSERANHILDPRTGRPVPAWGSVTVVAADAMTADVLSTALFVMGPRAALEWARGRSDIGVLILENTSNQPRATWNDFMSRLIVKE